MDDNNLYSSNVPRTYYYAEGQLKVFRYYNEIVSVPTYLASLSI